MTDSRKAAEQAYTVSAFDYPSAPVGSRDWCLFWKGWQAAEKNDVYQETVAWQTARANHAERERDSWKAKAEALIPLAIGWMYAEACVLMDKGEDIREIEAPYFLSRALLDLGQPKDARSAEKEKE